MLGGTSQATITSFALLRLRRCWILRYRVCMEMHLCSKGNGTLLGASTPPGAQGGPVPHTPPPVLVWMDPYHAEAVSSPTSAPSDHDVPPVLDL